MTKPRLKAADREARARTNATSDLEAAEEKVRSLGEGIASRAWLAVVEKAAESGRLVLLPDGSRRLWSDPDELLQLLEDSISEYLRSSDDLRGCFSDAMKLRRQRRARVPKITPAERAVCCGVQALVDAGDPQPVKRFKQQLRTRQLTEQSKQDESMRAVLELHTDRSLYALLERWRAQVAQTERLRQRFQALVERTRNPSTTQAPGEVKKI